MKDFDRWNENKKEVQVSSLNFYFKEQEIWWSRVGINIGVESDGKGNEFARPVLILKKHNKHSCLVVCLTTQIKDNKNYIQIDKENHLHIYANLSQIKVIDSKRLISKIFFLNREKFIKVKNKIIDFNFL